jgi:hypothetical protein
MLRSLFLGISFVLGAILIRFFAVPSKIPWIQALLQSEPVHIVSHLILYGSLSLSLLHRPRPALSPLWSATLTLCVALAQEAAQVIGQRSFGNGELFDLGVDSLAILLGITLAKTRHLNR